MIWVWGAIAGFAGMLIGAGTTRVMSNLRIRTLDERRKALEGELNRLTEENRKATETELALTAEVAMLRERVGQVSAQAGEKLALLKEAQERLSDIFRAQSAEALAHNNQRFLDLARKVFEGFQEEGKNELTKRTEAVQGWVKPLVESLGRFESKVDRLEKERVEGQATLLEQLRALAEVHIPQLSSETRELSRALHQPIARGHWGELQLRRLVEMAGMVEYCDFEEQKSVETEEGRKRPDLIVRLPGGQQIVVDAKAPVEAYFQSLDLAEDAAEDALREHARQIRVHIDALARKSYWRDFQPSPEFVVLFLPGEMLFSAALKVDPGLIEYGFERKVVVANPTTLLSLLKVLAYGWRQEAMTQNAEEVAALARTLYERAAVLVDHWRSVGERLNQAVHAYNDSVGSLERRFLVSLRRFEDLGVAQPSTSLDTPIRVDTAPQIPTPLLPDDSSS
ncbi:MAG: DNA recombination protein RmuC [Gammaproteobacteria bacterium]